MYLNKSGKYSKSLKLVLLFISLSSFVNIPHLNAQAIFVKSNLPEIGLDIKASYVNAMFEEKKSGLILDINNAINNINDNSNKLRYYSENSLRIAACKNKLAIKYLQQADSIIYNSEKKESKIKTNHIADKQKANQVQVEAEKLMAEAVAAFKIYSQLSLKFKDNKQIVGLLDYNLDDIRSQTDTNCLKKIENNLNLIMLKAEIAEKPLQIENIASGDYYQLSVQKEDNALELELNSISLIKQSKLELADSKRYFARSNDSHLSPKEKKTILHMADSLSSLSQNDNLESSKEFEKAKEMQGQAKIIRNLVEIENSIFKLIASEGHGYDSIKVNEIDKISLAKDLSRFESAIVYNNQVSDENEDADPLVYKTGIVGKKSASNGQVYNILVLADKQIDELQQNIHSLQLHAESLRHLTRQKRELAESTPELYVKLMKKARYEINQKTKARELKKAAQLKKDSARIYNEAFLTENIASIFDEKVYEQTNLLKAIIPDVELIKACASKNDFKNAEIKFQDINKKLKNKPVTIKALKDNIVAEFNKEADQKLIDADDLAFEAKKLLPVLDDAKYESVILKEDLIKEDNETKKEKIKAKYYDEKILVDSLDRKINQMKHASATLKVEADVFSSQANFANNIIKENSFIKTSERKKEQERLKNLKKGIIDYAFSSKP